jgi:hypothetical protein
MRLMSKESRANFSSSEITSEVDEASLEFQLAGETLALKALMIARDQRLRQFDRKRANVRASQAHSNNPHLRMSQSQLKKVIKALEKKNGAPQS